jgi:hypothetical protein
MQRLKKGTTSGDFLSQKKLKKKYQPGVKEPKKQPIK